MRILTAEAMQEVDHAAIEELGIPGLVLMENAAIGVVDAIGESFPEAESAVIFCGPGNNGGDGLAVARHLSVRGYEVYVFLVLGKKPSVETAAQLAICRRMELPIFESRRTTRTSPTPSRRRAGGLIVDALFGTGLARPLAGLFAALVGFERSARPAGGDRHPERASRQPVGDSAPISRPT